jgi:hypothetical protein
MATLNRKKQIDDIADADIEMKKFTCVTCSKEYFDMNLYFKDTASTKCLWCSKFPKPKGKK